MASQSKPTYFNIESDKEILDYANSLPSFSSWVKEKLREELENSKKPAVVTNDQPKKSLHWKI